MYLFVCLPHKTSALVYFSLFVSFQSELHPCRRLHNTWLKCNCLRRLPQPQLERQQSRVDAEWAGEDSGKPVHGHQRAG